VEEVEVAEEVVPSVIIMEAVVRAHVDEVAAELDKPLAGLTIELRSQVRYYIISAIFECLYYSGQIEMFLIKTSQICEFAI